MLYRMQLPKFVAAGVCIAILGAQIRETFPITREARGWYWPFLPYPMYAVPHKSGDYFIVPELRVAACDNPERFTAMSPAKLGVSPEQVALMLTTIAHASNSASGRNTSARLSRAIDAQFPGRYCAASAWIRVVTVADTATYDVSAPMRLAATWSMTDASSR